MSYYYLAEADEVEKYCINNPKPDSHCRLFIHSLSKKDLEELLMHLDNKPFNFNPCSWCKLQSDEWEKKFKKHFNAVDDG